MPHISIKMLKGRSDELKAKASKAVAEALCQALNCGSKHVSVAVEDYTAQEWQEVFKKEITDKSDKVFIQPQYDPKDLL